jgi:SpoVK/Ycf46/Vps4 family AAA+-type ATPase
MGSSGHGCMSWRAEEAIAGNKRALEALRELVINPFVYARESRKIGLKVTLFNSSILFSLLLLFSFLLIYIFSSCLILVDLDFGVFHLNFLSIWLSFQWPRGLLLYGPPGTGKVYFNGM